MEVTTTYADHPSRIAKATRATDVGLRVFISIRGTGTNHVMEGAQRTTFACIRWLHISRDNKIGGRCATPMVRVLGTPVEASPNENRRQSSQCIRKDVGGFRLIVAGRTKPFDPTRHQAARKDWFVRLDTRENISTREGKQTPSVWLDVS